MPAALEVPFLSSRLRHACSDHLRGLKAWVLNKTKHTKPQRGGRQKHSFSQGCPAAKALALPGAVLGEHTWVASWASRAKQGRSGCSHSWERGCSWHLRAQGWAKLPQQMHKRNGSTKAATPRVTLWSLQHVLTLTQTHSWPPLERWVFK